VRSAIAIVGASLVTCLTGCAPADTRATVEIAQPITNGTVDEGDSAVVALLASGQAYCTGTVVADRWVLTAAHCLQPPMSPSEVYIGKRPPADGQRRAVARTIVHPRFSFIGLQNDLGLVELVDSALVTPLPLIRRPLDQAWVGSIVRLAGFGSTSSTDREAPLKRTGTAKVTALAQQKFTLQGAPSQTCLADSGAPALYEEDGVEYVVGVSSSGDAHCQEHAQAVRVDAFADDFILPAIAESAGSYGCQQTPDRAQGLSFLFLTLVFLRAVARRKCGPARR
jgi:secreted trypsin-like serine protease